MWKLPNGGQVIKIIGLSKQNFIAVTMERHAANRNTITILGVIILTIGGKSQNGKEHTTKQFTLLHKM